MGCGCHAAKASTAKKQVSRNRTVVKNIAAYSTHAADSAKRIIRRTISH